MQLYGKQSGRDAEIARAAGRECMACWLVKTWTKEKDQEHFVQMSTSWQPSIAKNKGIRIDLSSQMIKTNPLDVYSDEELLAELNRRRGIYERRKKYRFTNIVLQELKKWRINYNLVPHLIMNIG